MKMNWTPLHDELAIWRGDRLTLPIWWRDDDAVAETPALDRLLGLSDETGVPVHVAVIPALLEPSLAPALAGAKMAIPLVHGWRHISHSEQGVKKAEFGRVRDGAVEELARGISVLRGAFGAGLLPVFVPPWNRIDGALTAQLRAAGYGGLSTYGPRAEPFAAEGVVQINTHIDPIFWRGHRGLVDPDTLIAGIVETLQDRRAGRADATEPLGLLTHHLVHTEDVWRFSGDLLRVLLDGGAEPADIAAHLALAP